jgi:hypothetical protein
LWRRRAVDVPFTLNRERNTIYVFAQDLRHIHNFALSVPRQTATPPVESARTVVFDSDQAGTIGIKDPKVFIGAYIRLTLPPIPNTIEM